MADNDNKLTSGSGGNTGGTGGPAFSGTGEGAGAGAAGPPGHGGGGDSGETGSLQEADRDEEFEQAAPKLREAIEGGVNAADAGPRGGKLSSEVTGNEGGGADPGDPGGMGGARAAPPNHDNRPPGGVSPVGSSSNDD